MKTKKIAKTLELIVGLLSQRQFEKLYALDKEKHLPAEDMPEFIDDYGGVITMPGNNQWDYDFYPIEGSNEVFIDYDLFVDNKLSDLTLQCKLTEENEGEYYPFSVHSIHIL